MAIYDVTTLSMPSAAIRHGTGRVFTGSPIGSQCTQVLQYGRENASSPDIYYDVHMHPRINWPNYYSS